MIDFLPSYIDVELWSLFVEGRKESKHPLTQAGQKLAIRKLMGLHNDGWDVNASLEDSTIKGYRGLFPVRKIGETQTAHAMRPNRQEALEKRNSDIGRAWAEKMLKGQNETVADS